MSNDRMLWLYFSPDGLSDPPGGLMYVKSPDGEARLHVCYSRAQLRAVLLAAEGTSRLDHQRSISVLKSCSLPEESDVPESIVHGWAASCIPYRMTDGGTRDFLASEEEIDAIGRVVASYHLILSVQDDATDALLAEFDRTGGRVWILPSRAAARRQLEAVRSFAPDAIYEESLRCLERSRLPEEDGERPMIRIIGGLGDIIVLALFCYRWRRQGMS